MKNSILIFGVVFPLFIMWSCQEDSSKKQNEKNTKPIVLSNSDKEASAVYLTETPSGNPIISWVEIDSTDHKSFYFSKLDTAKNSFNSRVSIPIEQNASIHEEGMPKIAVKGDGSLFATYETSIPLEDSKWGLGDVRYIQSFDDGENWTEPQSVAPKDLEGKKSSGFSNLIRLSNGEIGLAWLSEDPNFKGEGRPVKFAITEGNSLGDIKVINKQACECCRMALASDQNGTIALAYRNILDNGMNDIRDISISISNDLGETFSQPNSFSGDNWKLDGCPHNGPALTFVNNQIFATWFTGGQNQKGMNYAALDKSGKILQKKNLSTEGRFIQVDANENPIFTYNKDYKEDGSYYRKLLVDRLDEGKVFEEEISEPKTQANFPVIKGFNKNQAT